MVIKILSVTPDGLAAIVYVRPSTGFGGVDYASSACIPFGRRCCFRENGFASGSSTPVRIEQARVFAVMGCMVPAKPDVVDINRNIFLQGIGLSRTTI